MRSSLRIVAAVMALAVAGCAGRVAPAPVTPAPPVYDSFGHELVAVAPGVRVLANYDKAICYVNAAYWRFAEGRWYRSPLYTAGWEYVPPPAALLRIEQADAYVHYRPAASHTRQGRDRTARRVEPPRSMYQSPARRLTPLQGPESWPNTPLQP